MNRDVYDTLNYRSNLTGARIELDWWGTKGARGQSWRFRYAGTNCWFGGFRSKLDAIIAAANKCGYSAEKMDWTPEMPGDAPPQDAWT